MIAGKGANSASNNADKKKIIICCDGTWNSEERPHLTNVSLISRCIEPVDSNGVPQVVYYIPGVGTSTSWLTNIWEGATGTGLYENIRQAYSFICHNYSNGEDEIYLIGFSRGAFTVRAIAQLINDVGLLTKRGLIKLAQLFKLWESRHKMAAREELKQQCDFLSETELLHRGVRVNACAVWDTVASLKWPFPQLLKRRKRLPFVNSELCDAIEHGFQALALYEHRRDFRPMVWRGAKEGQTLKQCWFLGYHSDVGGGGKDPVLAHIPLVWMIAQLQEFISFNLRNQWAPVAEVDGSDQEQRSAGIGDLAVGYPGLNAEQVVEFSSRLDIFWFGLMTTITREKIKATPGQRVKLADSLRRIYRMRGSKYRRPLTYFWNDDGKEYEADPKNSRSQESMHASVRLLLTKDVHPGVALLDASSTARGTRQMWELPLRVGSKETYLIPEEDLFGNADPSGNGEGSSRGVPSGSISPNPQSELGLLKQWLEVELRRAQLNKEISLASNIKEHLQRLQELLRAGRTIASMLHPLPIIGYEVDPPIAGDIPIPHAQTIVPKLYASLQENGEPAQQWSWSEYKSMLKNNEVRTQVRVSVNLIQAVKFVWARGKKVGKELGKKVGSVEQQK